MDFFATALIEIAVELFFWIAGKSRKKLSVVGRPSVPLVPPP